MLLRAPDLAGLPQYLDALRRGWTPGSDHDLDAANNIIQGVEANPERFIAALQNLEGGGPPVQLADGSLVPRLAHARYWIWDDSYCGEVNLRWQPGTTELPPYCDGHVGYAVVPWQRGRGLAAAALRELAAVAGGYGLAWLELSMSAANVASVRTAEAAGAHFQGEYVAAQQGGVLARRYRLPVNDA
jgi:predicted acetyltransferase